jgi:hypothetical protein
MHMLTKTPKDMRSLLTHALLYIDSDKVYITLVNKRKYNDHTIMLTKTPKDTSGLWKHVLLYV